MVTKRCLNCGDGFPSTIRVNGKRKGLYRRRYCLKCSPYGQGNTKRLHVPALPDGRRVCARCQTEKARSEFYDRRGVVGGSPYCKVCTNQQTTERTQSLKRLAVAYMGGRCLCCGYTGCAAAFEFHHIDPTKKDFEIGQKKAVALSKIIPELRKTVLVCCRCHREIEAGERPCPTYENAAGVQPAAK